MRQDDREALEAVQQHIGCGRIYDLDFGRYKGYEKKGWAPHVKLRVGSVRDLAGYVVPFFRTHPLFGRKAVAFEIFAELVGIMAERRHLERRGHEIALATAQRLASHNARGLGSHSLHDLSPPHSASV
jgi:hypothetical protein